MEEEKKETLTGAEKQYKRMTETAVSKLVLQLGLPTTISMLVTNIYNMADTAFVSDLGNSASGAIGVVFALMAVIQAFGFMFGHGAGSNISRCLGAHKVERARMFASTSFFSGIVAGLCITIFGLIFQEPFMKLLGSTDTILPYAMEYSRYILYAAPLMVISCIMNNILRYEGKATFAMAGLVSGGLLNILGDYLLIRVFNMGVKGAGISTAVSQTVAATILYLPYLRKKVQSRFSVRYYTRDIRDLGNIIAVGLPSMMRQGLNSISVMLLNDVSKPFGDAAIAAMGIVARIVNAMFCVGLGVGQGFQPVSAFNYGAKKYSRVKKAFWFTCLFGTVVLGIIGVFGCIYAENLVEFFREDPEVVRIGAFALRCQAGILFTMPMTVCGNMLFQSIGKSGRATFLASTRSGLFFIPLIVILSSTLGLLGIQTAQAAADVLSSIISIPLVLTFLHGLPMDGCE